MRKSPRARRGGRFRVVYMTLVLLFLYTPILIVVLYSFNPSKNAGVMTGFTVDWYRQLFQNKEIGRTLINSLKLAAISVSAAAVIGTLGAIALARQHLRMQGFMEGLISLPIMVPEIVLGMSFLAAFTYVGLKLGMLTMALAHITFCIPYVFIIVKGRIAGLDPSLEEAARDLGANPVRVFFDITLPLVFPAVLAGMLLAFAMSFDDVIISFFVTGPGAQTLPLKVYSSLKVGVTPEINALCTLMLGVVFLLVAISQWIRARRLT
ncbi:ABC transporter permease subunit [Eubacteriales bacterium OttesenSCG-928-A19]|nr:ABC transporter permease subunit [Eubacteriales bacterium OttesenSCG-928-A19]